MLKSAAFDSDGRLRNSRIQRGPKEARRSCYSVGQTRMLSLARSPMACIDSTALSRRYRPVGGPFRSHVSHFCFPMATLYRLCTRSGQPSAHGNATNTPSAKECKWRDNDLAQDRRDDLGCGRQRVGALEAAMEEVGKDGFPGKYARAAFSIVRTFWVSTRIRGFSSPARGGFTDGIRVGE